MELREIASLLGPIMLRCATRLTSKVVRVDEGRFVKPKTSRESIKKAFCSFRGLYKTLPCREVTVTLSPFSVVLWLDLHFLALVNTTWRGGQRKHVGRFEGDSSRLESYENKEPSS